MEKCPECGNYSVLFEGIYERKICHIRTCGWDELGNAEAESDDATKQDKSCGIKG